MRETKSTEDLNPERNDKTTIGHKASNQAKISQIDKAFALNNEERMLVCQ
jgi:hypothetical protein